MGKRVNTAKWIDSKKIWRINVQKDGLRKSFYSGTRGRTGKREANAKADAWMENGIMQSGQRISELFLIYQSDVEATASTAARRASASFGRVWILPAIGNIKLDKLCDQDIPPYWIKLHQWDVAGKQFKI